MSATTAVAGSAARANQQPAGEQSGWFAMPTVRRSAKTMVVLVTLFTAWRYAWMSDDALITLRSGLNWAHGLGPQYNATEAVASYTHPLWFLLTTLSGSVTGSWVYGTLYLSLGLAAIAVCVLVARTRNSWQLLTVAAVLIVSNTVTDWSTSGLEGALAAAVVSGLFASMGSCGAVRRPMLSGAMVGCLLLCRLDYLLLVAPWLGATFWSMRHDLRNALRLAAGVCLPVLSWAAATVWHYGFLLPATFTAKTNATIPRTELVTRGLDYLRLSVAWDPVVLGAALAVLLVLILSRDRHVLQWGAGTAIYLAYVVWVGGDYMLGRFLLIPTFALLLAITQTAFPASLGLKRSQVRLLLIVPLMILTSGLFSALSLRWTASAPTIENPEAPIMDERPWWAALGRSIDPFGLETTHRGIIPSDLAFLDQQARRWPRQVPIGRQPRGSVLVRCGGLGAVGFLRPETFIIDSCGLTDRFMASLPFTPPNEGSWKAGHFNRPVPNGYPEAVEEADPTLVVDPLLERRLVDLWQTIRQRG